MVSGLQLNKKLELFSMWHGGHRFVLPNYAGYWNSAQGFIFYWLPWNVL